MDDAVEQSVRLNHARPADESIDTDSALGRVTLAASIDQRGEPGLRRVLGESDHCRP